MATAAILMLFMLSAAAHAVNAASTTTTATTTTTSESSTAENQTGDNGNKVQEQTGTTETQGTNNQVGENQAEGDNVNVVEVDEGEENQIQSAESDQTIAGEVQVGDTSASTSVTDSRFSLAATEGADGRLDVQVSGNNVNGPRSFLISLSKSMDPTTHTLVVSLDGQRVTQASSLGQVLHSSSSTANYVVVKSTSGYRLLVSVPHFSTHQLSILPLALGPSQGFFSISQVALGAAIVAITAAFAFVYASRKRIYTLIA